MNQDFTDFVCCVVDDGSTDGTADFVREVVSEDNRFAVVEQSHAGVSAARNLGASRLPATKYVSFPDSDDLWRPQALRTLIDSAELFGGVGAHALADEIDANGTVLDSGAAAQLRRERFISGSLRRRAIPLDSPSTFESLIQSCTLYPPGLVLTRRDAFEEVRGFDLSLWQFEDWDLYIRASRHGDYAFVNKVVVDYRRHPGQSVNNPWINDMYRVVLAKTLLSTLNSPQQREVALKAWRSWTFLSPLRLGYWALSELRLGRFKEASSALRDIPKESLRVFTGPADVRIPER